MRGVAVLAISHHQAATADRVPLAGVIHHGLDVESVPVGLGTGGYASFLGRLSPEKGPREAALAARAAGVPLRMAAKPRRCWTPRSSTARPAARSSSAASAPNGW
jgi:hypothetical protein